ncbi:hypothetical protein KBI5_23100 [Frankia sp. KB5]|nr:hypothetical protein KBI5_23100 [Frankia sp. KB5]
MGGSAEVAAASTPLTVAELHAAAATYRAGGQAALANQRPGWHQFNIHFPDWQTAEQTAAEFLLPALLATETAGTIDGWWFIRKHPNWRLRVHTPPPGADATTELETALDRLVKDGQLTSWQPGIYEAETAAFGGGPAMDIAHDLFIADSRAVLRRAATRPAGGLPRRELSVLLCSALAKGAGLEWYERGDLFARVAADRPLPAGVNTCDLATLTEGLSTLLHANPAPDGPVFGPGRPGADHADHATAFTDAGHQLAGLNRAGTLRRGLREILAYHVIFHWNRGGLPTRTQALLAHAGRQAILGPHDDDRKDPRQPGGAASEAAGPS